MTDFDWTAIQEVFNEIVDDLRGQKYLGSEEDETYRLSRLTYGLVRSAHKKAIDYSFERRVPQDKGIRGLWIALIHSSGAQRSDDLKLELPSYLEGMNIDDFGVVSQSIDLRRVSMQFLESWTRLNVWHSQYLLLLQLEEMTSKSEENALSGVLSGNTEVQKYWYAHWLGHNARSLSPNDRIDAAQELGVLCADIVHGRIRPWGPYPKEWYGRVLGNEGGRDVGDRFQRIGETSLRRMIEHPLLTPAVLPPLNRDEFELLDQP